MQTAGRQHTLAQAAFAAVPLVSAIATYIALSPPRNARTDQAPGVDDSLDSLGVTGSGFRNLAMSQLFVLALYTSLLAFFHPNVPASLLRHGRANGFNERLITWSSSTVVPVGFGVVGISLRLVPYAALGENFTFFLSSPDHLVTTGIYAYLQHPSYAGLVILLLANFTLMGRTDGVICCWFPPRWYGKLRGLAKVFIAPTGMAILLFAVWTRVIEEEAMLRRHFGEEWETWHERTARFIPGIF